MRLAAVEISRALSRRLVRLLFVLCAAGIVIAGIITLVKSHPAQGFTTGVGVPGEGFFVRDTRFHYAHLTGILRGTTVPWGILSLVIGASLIGAEWRAGTMTTLLTWEPKRLRLIATKALVAVALAFVFSVALQLLLMLALAPAALLRGTTDGVDATFWRSAFAVIGRGGLLASVLAAIGFAIGSVGKNTAAALGVTFLYVVVLDGGLIGSSLPWLRPWLVVGNAVVLVTGEPVFGVSNRGVGGAAVLLSLYGVGAIVAAAAVFRARDVT